MVQVQQLLASEQRRHNRLELRVDQREDPHKNLRGVGVNGARRRLSAL